MVLETPADLEPGQWYYSTPDAVPKVVADNTTEVDHESGTASGEIRFFDHGHEENIVDSDSVWQAIEDDELIDISDKAGEDPRAIVFEFARREIAQLNSRLGRDHDYNGVDGVSTVADLRAALEMAEHGVSL